MKTGNNAASSALLNPFDLRELRLHTGNGGSGDSEWSCGPDLLWQAFHQQSRLVERFAHGWPLNPLADVKVWYSFDAVGYTDFPRYEMNE